MSEYLKSIETKNPETENSNKLLENNVMERLEKLEKLENNIVDALATLKMKGNNVNFNDIGIEKPKKIREKKIGKIELNAENLNYEDILTKQEFVVLKPSKITDSKVELSLTYREYEAVKQALETLKSTRLSSRKYSQQVLNVRSRNIKKTIYTLEEIK